MSAPTAPSTDSTSLYAAAKVIGVQCSALNADFLKCKQSNENPKDCLLQGEKVTGCVLKVIRTLEDGCPTEFQAYRSCLKDNRRKFDSCRDAEKALADSWNALVAAAEQSSDSA